MIVTQQWLNWLRVRVLGPGQVLHYWGSEGATQHSLWSPPPCKAISKVYSRGEEEEGQGGIWGVFSGGMPRASYGGKFTVSVMRNIEEEELHTVFDLTSKIIDWVVVEQEDTPDSLLGLSEEELVCVDLGTPGWLAGSSPYMQSIHSCAITAISQVNNVTVELVERLEGLSGEDRVGERWPVSGGVYSGGKGDTTVIITGHEDGSVKFWLSKSSDTSHHP